jgi:hypothetical protein
MFRNWYQVQKVFFELFFLHLYQVLNTTSDFFNR